MEIFFSPLFAHTHTHSDANIHLLILGFYIKIETFLKLSADSTLTLAISQFFPFFSLSFRTFIHSALDTFSDYMKPEQNRMHLKRLLVEMVVQV